MLIGVTGYAQHGKDTVADHLVGHHGFIKVSFATPLKALALAINPYVGIEAGERLLDFKAVQLQEVVDARGWDGAKTELREVRRFLQALGTEAREVMGQDVWIDALKADLIDRGLGFWDYDDEYDAPVFRVAYDVVISDVRFPNEAKFVKGIPAAEVWKVTRPDFDNGVGTSHPSEAYVSGIQPTRELINDNEIEDLLAQVDAVLAERSVRGL